MEHLNFRALSLQKPQHGHTAHRGRAPPQNPDQTVDRTRSILSAGVVALAERLLAEKESPQLTVAVPGEA